MKPGDVFVSNGKSFTVAKPRQYDRPAPGMKKDVVIHRVDSHFSVVDNPPDMDFRFFTKHLWSECTSKAYEAVCNFINDATYAMGEVDGEKFSLVWKSHQRLTMVKFKTKDGVERIGRLVEINCTSPLGVMHVANCHLSLENNKLTKLFTEDKVEIPWGVV